jgi:hypothetical protein
MVSGAISPTFLREPSRQPGGRRGRRYFFRIVSLKLR